MKTTFLKSLTGVTATMLLAGYAGAQVTVPEVEGNETKATATPASGLVSGDMLTGTTTGTSTTSVGAGNSADMFRVKTAAAALGVYRHRLVLTTTGTAGHTGAIMGLPSSGNPSETDSVQTSGTGTTPARMNQWYGFGKEEELYYKVTGGASTTQPYVATLTSTPVTVINAGNIAAGPVVLTTVGQGHTTDTEIFLYDSNFNLLRLNDDDTVSATARSRIAQTLTPGTYYLAVGTYNTATSAALESAGQGEGTTAGARMDFPNSLAASSSTTNVNVAFSINDVLGNHQFAATRNAFDVVFAQFTVVSMSTPPTGTFAANPTPVEAGSNTLLTVTVLPGGTPASTGITVVGDLTAIGGSSTQTFYDNGTNGDVTAGDNVFSYAYTVPGPTTGGSKTIPFTVADAESRSSNGNGSLTVTAPPAGIDLGTLVPGVTTAPTASVMTAQAQWYKFTLANPVSNAAGTYLDIVSNAVLSGGTFTNDTIIGLFNSSGTLVASDDDDGPGSFSALSFGLTSPTRPSGDVAHNGRDGSLAAGTYYLVVSGYNCTYAANWSINPTSNSSGTVGASLSLGPATSSPTVNGNSSGGLAGQTVLVTGTVVPGTIPTSTGLAVTADLSAFGGSATQVMVDDGTGGDATAGDNIFSYSLSIPGAQAAGNYTVNLSVSDAQSRTGSGSALVAVDDAGPLPHNARHIDGVGAVTSFTGNISPAQDVDMFRIFICDPASFSASVVTDGGTLADSQLFLFRPDGTGIAFNDDRDANSALSTITGPLTAALTPGEYYLAISDYNNDPRDSNNALIWANSPFTGVRAPDGPGFANPLASWDTGGGDTGTYTIALTGVNGQPCTPPSGSCCLGQYCFVTSAEDCAGQGGSFGGSGTTCASEPCAANCGSSDFNHDGDYGTDADIEAFFACLGGNCCPTCDTSDFNGDSDFGTDADIEAFFRVLSGGNC